MDTLKPVKSRAIDRIFHVVVFACLFAFLGWAIPRIYFYSFDKTEYLTFDGPVTTDRKIYKPCEKIRLTAFANVVVPLQVENVMTLVKIISDNHFEKDPGPVLHFTLNKGKDQVITTDWDLPCSAKEGIYYYEGINKFQFQGADKTFYYISEQFRISTMEAKLQPASTPQGNSGLSTPLLIAPQPVQNNKEIIRETNTTTTTKESSQNQPTPTPTPEVCLFGRCLPPL